MEQVHEACTSLRKNKNGNRNTKQRNGRSKNKFDIQLFLGSYWVKMLQEAQWREMDGNQDVRTLFLFYSLGVFLLSSLNSRSSLWSILQMDALFTQNANCLASWPHIWISLQHKPEKSSCIFKQLLSVADLKWVMVTKDIYIKIICEWYLFSYFWQATAFWWKHFRMFRCLIFFITITMETYCLIARTGIGKIKPG